MSFFRETGMVKEAEQSEKVKEIDRPQGKTAENLRLAPDDDRPGEALQDALNRALERLGFDGGTALDKKTGTDSAEKSGINEPAESRGRCEYLEKGEDGNYYSKETGKAYDSVEAWEKAQQTLEKRYESIADFYEKKANREYARFRNAAENGESEAQKWEHYRRAQECYAKGKECREKAAAVRERLSWSRSDEKPDTGEADEKNHSSDVSECVEKDKPIQNKQDGLQREDEVREELKKAYPLEKGYEVISEAYLRDSGGGIVKDPETGQARRIDFVVVKDGKAVDSIEVTSKTADKSNQIAKENRVRENGGNYVRDKTGSLIEIPGSVRTRVERRD